jgi:electron transport complex protein RnfB
MESADSLADRIDALLPQTQCRRCGYDGCRPYAQALARGDAELNRCPPGGAHVIGRLAALLARAPLPLDPSCGRETAPAVAWVDEPACIGCARCLDVCPTDAIVGARKHVHTVIAADCPGCELCLPVCPVDCIHMVPAPGLPARPLAGADIDARAPHFRRLYEARLARLAAAEAEQQRALRASLPGDGAQGG